MKLTEIKENLIKDLDNYVGEFTFFLYHHGMLIWTQKANKSRLNQLVLADPLLHDLDKLLGSRAYNHLKDDSNIDGYGFRIEGTITYEIRHDYIPTKDGDDA